jgi:hypothetical protein
MREISIIDFRVAKYVSAQTTVYWLLEQQLAKKLSKKQVIYISTIPQHLKK